MSRSMARSRDGTSIGYVQVGEGPPLVLVHGAWASADAWLGVAELLGEHVSCHVMDRRGRGESGDGPRYDLECELADIEAVLDAAGPGASLLGHSSGAIYALEVARRAPIDRLVLYEPPLRWRGAEARSFLDRFEAEVAAGRDETAATLFYREEARLDEDELSVFRATPAWSQRVSRAWTCVREWTAILDAGLTAERYGDVSVPTLLLTGTETREHPSFATRELHEVLPDARVAVLEGQGHMAHHAAPDLVARKVASFLATTVRP